MAREPFNRTWAEEPEVDQFGEPTDAMWRLGWEGGADKDPPEAYAQNYWQNRVDFALQQIERTGFMEWNSGAIYMTGAIARGSDGVLYEFYDRDQSGQSAGDDPADALNRPHIWMEWDGVRPGTTIEWRSETLPEGYVENDGAAVSRAAYRRVFAALGITYGAGDGATTFNLPEDRGDFKRGWDHGRGVDAGRALGDEQLDALQNITGNVSRVATSPLGLAPSGAFTAIHDGAATDIAAASGDATWNITFNASNVARTATETRSRNNAVIWLTKI